MMTGGKLVRSTDPGIYRRHADSCSAPGSRCGCPWVVVLRGADGRQVKRTARTQIAARELKRQLTAEVALSRAHRRGRHHAEPVRGCPECARAREEIEQAQPTLCEYLVGWVERYAGTGRRGYREETRDEDRRLLRTGALAYFPDDLKLNAVTPRHISEFIASLVARDLADGSIRNMVKPLRSALATARREGLILHNPADGAALPHRERVRDDEEKVRVFPGGAMEMVVELIHPKHRQAFELLAVTGLRRSELLALRVRDLMLGGGSPQVKVRQRVRRRVGAGLLIGPLKSRHARRDLPIACELADKLRTHVAGRSDHELVFPSAAGTPLDPDNVAERILRPALEEAGCSEFSMHDFRHTVASRLLAERRSIVQVQRFLGHFSASLTLSTYAHLLSPDDLGGPLEPLGAHIGATLASNPAPTHSVPQSGATRN